MKRRYLGEKQSNRTKLGHLSGLEDNIALQLQGLGVKYSYEKDKIKYTIPESNHTYTPDFILSNGIIIEGKGLFSTADRKKHLLIKEQHPELDIRFVFSRSHSPLYKGSKNTYGGWCNQKGFLYADKLIPNEWLKERKKK